MARLPFQKVLVANRGEIAVRIMRTLRELGLRSVAVYSEADREALHVRYADEAVLIGPAPSNESYLRLERLVEAARRTGAQAVHPGYGFLSERAAFARAVLEAGLTWIGPPPQAIEAMGDKVRARQLMKAAAVPVVPGTEEAIADAGEALFMAREIGFPVLIKAAAGGGGKGMRRVNTEADLREAFEAASREALAAFGNGEVYLERYILEPRHVEIQVLADRHGHTVHLFERDCSIQRRHQKVIEETPCPVLDPEVRARMGAVAVQAARAVGYENAGTVEFLLDAEQSFYFLEMNTRLQVEHPVTEWVTGLDLVALQVRVAAGEPLPFAQEDLHAHGAAIEARLYAEDPERGFLPSPGEIVRLNWPSGPGIRVDEGVYEGCRVPPHYDPLIAKVTAWAETREQACARLERALEELVVVGLRHNGSFLRRVVATPEFRSGRYDIGYIDRHLEAIVAPDSETAGVEELAEVAAVVAAFERDRRLSGAAAGATGNGQRRSAWREMGRLRQLRR
jgi:acetyl-CoA carboxylase biotin carboxylase subunit